MSDMRFGEEVVRQLGDPFPCGAVLLTAPLKRALPAFEHMVVESGECATIGRHRVVIEVPTDDLRQPSRLLRDRLVHTQSQPLFYLPELGPHAVAARLPVDQGLAADECEAQEVEGLRLPQPAPLAVLCRKTSELDQPGLLGMQ